METTVFYVAISIGVFISIATAIILPILMSGKRFKAAEAKAKARRLADAKMNARLLRMNL